MANEPNSLLEKDDPHFARAARGALARVVDSDDFRNAENIRSFLTYVVEETLAGRERQLKGYTIAVNALGRRPDFDPALDPIVRVEANRLRKMLTAYYADLGRHDPVRIVLTPGSYVPAFIGSGEPVAVAALAAKAEGPSTRAFVEGPPSEQFDGAGPSARRLGGVTGLSVALGAALLAVVVLSLVFVSDLSLSRRPVMAADDQLKSCSAPQGAAVGHLLIAVNATRSVAAPFDIDIIAVRLREALARFDLIEVIAQEACLAPLRPDYTILLRAEAGSQGRRLVVSLLRTRPEGLAWSRVFYLGEGPSADAAVDRAIMMTASMIGTPGGVGFSDRLRFPEAASMLQVCVAVAHVYYRTISPADFQKLMQCFDQVERENPNGLWSTLVRGYLAMSNHWRAVPSPDGRPQVEHAADLANRALGLSPSSARAHHILSQASFARGDFESGRKHGQRAIAINPAEPEIKADVGSRMIGAGMFEEGVRLIYEALSYMPTPFDWHTFHLYVAARHAGDAERMDILIGRMVGDTTPFGLAASVSRHAAAGRMPEAASTLARLRQLHPLVPANFGTILRRYLANPLVAEPLIADFEAALSRIDS